MTERDEKRAAGNERNRMTRDEWRAKCIEAIETVLRDRFHFDSPVDRHTLAENLFNAQHDRVRVCPIEATDEMLDPRVESEGQRRTWRFMSAVGDLTNPPEKKP